MRNTFAKTLLDLARRDPRVVMLSADIGNRLFDEFKAEFPQRFHNCGVAEANMIGVAAGMAMCGLRPIVYTIAPFVTTRCLEQIRVDLCYHHQPVVIAGVGAGLSYGELGATHHACEDIAMLRCLPGMTVVCPADCIELRAAMAAAVMHHGPVYLRLGKKGEPDVHGGELDASTFALGKAITLRPGRDVCLLATGNLVAGTLEVADLLQRRGVSAQVVSMHTVKPLDEAMLAESFARFGLVVTIEEHSVIGGLGGAVAEWLADRALELNNAGAARLLRLGTPDVFPHQAGHQDDLRELAGLTPAAMAKRIAEAMGGTGMALTERAA
ncbi:MAG: transketolase C-terminal domain-containing protein [Phycisphaeraceae bacterium]